MSFCNSLRNFIQIRPSAEKNDVMSIFKMADLSHLGLLAVWLSGNVVALRQTRLVPGWVTVCGRVNHLGMPAWSTQPSTLCGTVN